MNERGKSSAYGCDACEEFFLVVVVVVAGGFDGENENVCSNRF